MPSSNGNIGRSDIAFLRAVRHASSVLGEGQDRDDGQFALDLMTILDHPHRSRAIAAVEDLASTACTADHEGGLRVLAIEMRIDSDEWEGFEQAAKGAEEACHRMTIGGDRDTLLGLVALGRAHLRCEAGDQKGAATIYLGLTKSKSGHVAHLAETHLGLLALERDEVADAEEHLCRSVEVTEDKFLLFRGYSAKLCNALDQYGTTNPRVLTHMQTIRAWRPPWKGTDDPDDPPEEDAKGGSGPKLIV